MYIIVTDNHNNKHYINLEHVTSFYYKHENNETVICKVSGVVIVKEDITKQIAEVLRMSGVTTRQIGE